jgi:hypothetical protein
VCKPLYPGFCEYIARKCNVTLESPEPAIELSFYFSESGVGKTQQNGHSVAPHRRLSSTFPLHDSSPFFVDDGRIFAIGIFGATGRGGRGTSITTTL